MEEVEVTEVVLSESQVTQIIEVGQLLEHIPFELLSSEEVVEVKFLKFFALGELGKKSLKPVIAVI